MRFGQYKRLLIILAAPLIILGVVVGELLKHEFIGSRLDIYCTDFHRCVVHDIRLEDNKPFLSENKKRVVGLSYNPHKSNDIHKKFSSFYIEGIHLSNTGYFATVGGDVSRLDGLKLHSIDTSNKATEKKLYEFIKDSKFSLWFIHDHNPFKNRFSSYHSPKVYHEDGEEHKVVNCMNTPGLLSELEDGTYAVSCEFHDYESEDEKVQHYAYFRFNFSDSDQARMEYINELIIDSLSKIKFKLTLFRAISYFSFLGLFLISSLLVWVCLKSFSWIRRG